MNFLPTELNVTDYMQRISDMLNDKDCHVFIDTNILSQLYKLNDKARGEFLSWADSIQERFHIPNWVVMEYNKRAKKRKLGDYVDDLGKIKSIKKELLGQPNLIEKHIAVLGGSTTHDIIDMLELFLLNYGIRPVFFESEYAQYWQDAMFGNDGIKSLEPDIIFIHTSNRNITAFPQAASTKEETDELLRQQFDHFAVMWEKLREDYHCPIIQNNFEYPFFRVMGNQDAAMYQGRVNFVTRLNMKFYEYAQSHDAFFINDINYQSADYGLKEWSDPHFWHMYKYALCMDAVPYLSYNVANIIKSIFGKNKKGFNLDLDNTLWGGIIGDDGAENIEIGRETALAQIYSEFQEYLKLHKQIGVILTVNSKNDEENAKAGFMRPDSVLKCDDFVSFKADWDPKSINLARTAQELSLLPESFVFVDDNPAEREIIRSQFKGTAIPEIEGVEHYIQTIDRSGFFEVTNFTADDLKRNEQYIENAKRHQLEMSFENYDDYLRSLEMKGEIRSFVPMYMSRIAQLTNKTNQFNLTTKRYTQAEIEQAASDNNHITI